MDVTLIVKCQDECQGECQDECQENADSYYNDSDIVFCVRIT